MQAGVVLLSESLLQRKEYTHPFPVPLNDNVLVGTWVPTLGHEHKLFWESEARMSEDPDDCVELSSSLAHLPLDFICDREMYFSFVKPLYLSVILLLAPQPNSNQPGEEMTH